MSLSGPQLTQLMNHPHRLRAFAVLKIPSTIFEADVETDFYDHNVIAVPYENGAGTPSDVLDGMTLMVYDSLGRLRGKVRTKGADSSYIYIAENDEITFDDGQTLVVTDNIPFWTKFPNCDISGDDPIFYKDYNVAYTDQNTYPPPVPILGPALRCLVLEDETSVTWSASQSYSPRSGGSISSYSWVFEGGTPGSSSSPSQAVTYASPGIYRTKLTVTDDQSKTAVAYRWIRVLNTHIDGTVVDCDVTLNGSFGQGGWTLKLTGYTNSDIASMPDHTLVSVICESYDGDGELLDFGGFSGANNVYFCGYLMRDTVEQVPGSELVTFEATTIDKVMAETFGFDAFVYDASSPSDWIEMTGVNARSAGNHLIRWHSNLMEIADVFLPSDTTANAGIDMPQGDFFSQIRNMCQSVRLLQVGCSHYGSLHIEKNVQHMKWSERNSIGKHFTMFKQLYTGEPVKIPRLHRRKVSMLECAGVLWDGSDPEPLFSRAPGIVPINEGKTEQVSGLACADQDDLNTLCGMVYAEKINPLVNITMSMAGDLMPAADVFPQAMIELPSDFTIRGQSYVNEWIVPREITFEVDEGGVPQTSWVFDLLCQESTARPFWYPLEPATPVPPPWTPPPTPPPPPPVAPPLDFPPRVIVLAVQDASDAGGLYWADIQEESIVWTSLNNNLGSSIYRPNWFSRDPVFPNDVGYLCTSTNGIYRNDDLHGGGDWVNKLNQATAVPLMNDSIGGGGGNIISCTFRKMKPQVSLPGALYVLAVGYSDDARQDNWLYIFRSFDRGENWAHSHHMGYRCGDTFGYEWWCSVDDWWNGAGMNGGQLSPSAHNPYTVFASGYAYDNTALRKHCFWRIYGGNFGHSLSWERLDGGTGQQTPATGIHIPYKDNQDDGLIYLLGWEVGGTTRWGAKFTQGGWTSTADWRNCGLASAHWEGATDLELPVDPGGMPALFGSYTYDKNIIYVAQYNGNKMARSLNGGDSWSWLTDIPESEWDTGCASGFPYNQGLIFVGRNKSPTGAQSDTQQLIYYSDDEGVSWNNITGDLYSKVGGNSGLACIAPQWSS